MTVLRDVQVGTLSYNGRQFDSFHTSKVSARVVYDDAGRVVKWQEITIEVEAKINIPDLGADPQTELRDLWRDLSEPGGELIYSDKGFGDFLYVNSPGANEMKDVNWGPKPTISEFVPVGSNNVVHLSWKVVTHIVSCPGAKFKDHLFNFTFEAGYDLDADGYLTMSLNGAYEIPMTFSTSQGAGGPLNVPSSADRWWDKVCPPVQLGFRRETKTRRISRDRRRVDFSIVDKELPTPLPPGCTMIEAKHRVRNDKPVNFAMWTSTISGTVRVNPTLPRSASWERFWLLLASRMKWARTHQGQPGQVIPGKPIVQGWGPFEVVIGHGRPRNTGPRAAGVLLMNLEFEEDVFGKDARFAATYRIMGVHLATILQQSGLWRPIPNTSHAAWKASMDGTVNKPYGPNGARFKPYDDVMIDLCGGPAAQQAPTPNNAPAPTPPPNIPPDRTPRDLLDRTPSSGADDAAANQAELFFSPGQSWIYYDAQVKFLEDDHIIRHKPLKGKVTTKNPKTPANSSVGGILTGTSPELLLTDWDTADVFQQVCSPDTSVVLMGRAIRLGYHCEAPRLIKFGTKTVTQAHADIREMQLGSIQGIPIWGLAWRIEYYLGEPAARMPTLANPVWSYDGSDGQPSLPTAIPTQSSNPIGATFIPK